MPFSHEYGTVVRMDSVLPSLHGAFARSDMQYVYEKKEDCWFSRRNEIYIVILEYQTPPLQPDLSSMHI